MFMKSNVNAIILDGKSILQSPTLPGYILLTEMYIYI